MASIIGIIVLASLARFAVGAVWYMPKGLFGKKWLALQGLTPDAMMEMQKKDGSKPMLYGFLATLLSTFVLALLLMPLAQMTAVQNLPIFRPVVFLSLIVWLGFVIPLMIQRKVYDCKKSYSWSLFWIDASYELVGLIVASLVLVALL